MQVAREGDIFVLKLEHGEDLFECFGRLYSEHGIGSGLVLSGIGMLHSFELGYFDGGEYRRTSYPEPHELTSLQGTLATATEGDEVRFMPHLHATLAGPDHGVVGGHLFRAKVNVINEIAIRRLGTAALRREMNDGTCLWELTL